MNDLPDWYLVECCRRGDMTAFSELMGRHERTVLAIAFGIVGDGELARDITQETFLAAYQKLDTLRSPDRFKAWLTRIAHTRSRNALRGRKPTPVNDEALAQTPVPEIGQERFERENDIERTVQSALAAMPETLRAAVTLRHMEEASIAEIAEALGIHPNAAARRLERGMAWLREYFERTGRWEDAQRLLAGVWVVTPSASSIDEVMDRVQRLPTPKANDAVFLTGSLWKASTITVGSVLFLIVAWYLSAAVTPLWAPQTVDDRSGLGLGRDQSTEVSLLFDRLSVSLPDSMAERRSGTPATPITGALTTTKLLFAAGDGQTYADLYSMNADGRELTRLTNNGAVNREATWSPDGMKIAFASDESGKLELHVMNTDGSNKRRLTHGIGGGFPTWSPDSRRIAYCSDSVIDGVVSGEIYAVDVDGLNLRRLTHHIGNDSDPAWSPDGSAIAFVSSRHNVFGTQNDTATTSRVGPSDLYLMNPDGSNVRRVSYLGEMPYSPSWSPDGKRLVWAAGNGGGNRLEIYAMNADGTDLRRITDNTFNDNAPRFSPDGTKIVFWSNRESPNDLYVMSVDGSNQMRLTTGLRDRETDRWLSWSISAQTQTVLVNAMR
ncbi:MAG: sigma-70 family RNA polymerase sigma factor [Candidatus Poribacteria bacterium]|nr:sigma-70 family RNA polymerase sigma factor [Candidatus Poribacteria bacterium]